jgi:TolB-like protein/DNA-binding Xre family transcriptional regulator
MSTEKPESSRLVDDQNRLAIARQIKSVMVRRGLTQRQLSDMACYDERTLRNVLKGLPVRDRTLHDICAVLAIDPIAEPFSGEMTPLRSGGALRVDRRASIAVLPLVNISGDPDQDYFSDGMAEDILTELSRFPELLVIARTSSFRYKGQSIDVRRIGRELSASYLLEGSVRRAGDSVRVSAQLIDAETQGHVWAERYDRQVKEVFSLQAELASTIVAALPAFVTKAEVRRSFNKPPESLLAYDHYLRAAHAYERYFSLAKPEPIYAARSHLKDALDLESDYARAWATLAATTISTYVSAFDDDHLNPAALARAHDLASTAVQLDPGLPYAHAELGNVLIWNRRPDEAVESFQRAFSINPNFADYRYSAALLHAGKAEAALEAYRIYRRFAPFPNPHAVRNAGFACYLLMHYSEAALHLQEATALVPGDRTTRSFLAATFAQLGKIQEAKAEIAEVLRIAPSWSIAKARSILLNKSVDDRELLLDGLRKSGLPES